MTKSKVEPILADLGIREPPIPVELVAKKLGVEVRYSPFEGEVSGMVYRNGDRVIIGVNSLHHVNRQRFSIAHEIAHILLHRNKLHSVHIDKVFMFRNTLSAKAIDPVEMEANQFAADLLMPESMLEADLARYAIDYEDERQIKALANRYRVSSQAMTFRITKLLDKKRPRRLKRA